MGGFGSMLHAVSSMKANMALKRSKRREKSKDYKKGTYKEREFNFPKVSGEELEKIRAALRAKRLKRRKKEYLITGIVSLIVFILLYWLLFN